MRDTVLAVALELAGALERWPTGPEIAEAAWSQYEANVDLSRPGRGKDEMEVKAAYLAQRLPTGAVEGAPSLPQAIGRYREQQQARTRAEAPQAPKHSRLSPHSPGNGEWKWEEAGPTPASRPEPTGPEPIRANPVGLDWTTITRPRRWIYGRHLIGGFVSLTVAPGGTGKTALLLAESVAMATGKPLLGEQVHNVGPTWHFNLEDPLEELQRRLGAIIRHHHVDTRDIAGRVHINSGRNRGLIVAKRLAGMSGGMVAMPDADGLIAEIKRLGIMALSVDPFVAAHYANENDNSEVAFVLSVFNRIAEVSGVAIDLAHHVRKPPAGGTHADGDINQARGASAMAGAVRAARTLSPMSADDAKASMAPPRDRAMWLQFKSIDIENGVGLEPSDMVAVLTPWAPANRETLLSSSDRDAVLAEIDRAYIAGNGYSPRNQAGYGRRYSLAFERAMPGRAPPENVQSTVVRYWLDSKVGILKIETAGQRTDAVRAGRIVVRVAWENVETTTERDSE
ncbi:MAG: hypothetical protein FJX68_18185 [Alphaproteobacteria bacterium]|nr:hypothetical protein [Alphaproteobacteria bacterium]